MTDDNGRKNRKWAYPLIAIILIGVTVIGGSLLYSFLHGRSSSSDSSRPSGVRFADPFTLGRSKELERQQQIAENLDKVAKAIQLYNASASSEPYPFPVLTSTTSAPASSPATVPAGE